MKSELYFTVIEWVLRNLYCNHYSIKAKIPRTQPMEFGIARSDPVLKNRSHTNEPVGPTLHGSEIIDHPINHRDLPNSLSVVANNLCKDRISIWQLSTKRKQVDT